jgi:DNA adenine methylase
LSPSILERTKGENFMVKPFISYAGGKTQLLPLLSPYFPEHFDTYYEPFLGGGTVFLYLATHRPQFNAVLADISVDLMTTWRVVKDNVEELIKHLEIHKRFYMQDSENYYYHVRDNPIIQEQIDVAARTIFLNKTCFNGLYRVNKKGKFNVPWGKGTRLWKVDETENLRNVSSLLKKTNAKLLTVDYPESTKNAEECDFVYLDPPYLPVSKTANFTAYTSEGFNLDKHKMLASYFRELDERGCRVVLSNSNVPIVRLLYSGYPIQTVDVKRQVNCKPELRSGQTELIINNMKTIERSNLVM